MLLTLTATQPLSAAVPATDLGYLLHKNPNRVHEASLPSGKARLFYAEATTQRCLAVLQVEAIETQGDRPYVCSSLMSNAIRAMFGTALAGRCKDRPELVDYAMPLELELSMLRDSKQMVNRLFAPLGYEVHIASFGPYFRLRLRGTVTVREALTHLYVLLPALDETQDDHEVDRFVSFGHDWVANHPEQAFIRQRSAAADLEEDTAVAIARQLRARSVLHLGCGTGKLLERLLAIPLDQVVGWDESRAALAKAAARLRGSVKLLQGSLQYQDPRLAGYDLIILTLDVQDPWRFQAVERAVFQAARPQHVLTKDEAALSRIADTHGYSRSFITAPPSAMAVFSRAN